jgi:hypothetical protein
VAASFADLCPGPFVPLPFRSMRVAIKVGISKCGECPIRANAGVSLSGEDRGGVLASVASGEVHKTSGELKRVS